MLLKKIFLFLFACIILAIPCDAQRRHTKKVDKRFSAGIVGGITMSQIDGDLYQGYDHSALTGGLKISAFIHDKLSFDVNFLYVQKGASIENEEIEFRASYAKDRWIHLDYIEVPFLLTLKPHGSQSKLFFEGGVSFGKMIQTTIVENVRDFTDISYEVLSSDFNSTDISAITGIGSYLTKNISLGFRFSYGLNKMYVNENPIFRETLYETVPKQVFFLRNYYISANVSYNIF